MSKLWACHEQVMNKSWLSHEQVMIKSWSSHDQVISQSWANHEPVMSQSWASYDPVIGQSCDSHETVMRLARGVLKVLTRLLLPATKLYPQVRKSHTWIKTIANSLKSIYVKEIIGRKRNERWELSCSLQELRGRVSKLFNDCLMTGSWLAHDWLNFDQSLFCNKLQAINFQQSISSN